MIRDSTSPSVRRLQARRHQGIIRVLTTLWAMVTEPRHMSVIYGGVYTLVALTGIGTLAVPPQTIASELGPVLSVAWATLFIFGGALGMVTVLPGWWAWERWAILLTLAGIGIYGLVITTLHFTAAGSRLTQMGVLALASSVFVVRWALIRGRTYGPRGR